MPVQLSATFHISKSNPNAIETVDIVLNQWKFPGGEIGIRLMDEVFEDETYNITVNGIISSDDIISLANICNALKHNDIPRNQISVTMPYFPYARQDRVCHSGESFALETFINLIDSMYFHRMTVYDLHSSVSTKLLNQSNKIVHEVLQHELMINLPKHDWYIAPDAGATAKINKHANVTDDNLIVLNKTRTSNKVIHEIVPLQNNFEQFNGKAVVIDDICDGGATFISVAQTLKKINPTISLSLAITHGIFSKGLDELKQYYDTLYVVNLMNSNINSSEVIQLTV